MIVQYLWPIITRLGIKLMQWREKKMSSMSEKVSEYRDKARRRENLAKWIEEAKRMKEMTSEAFFVWFGYDWHVHEALN